MRILLAALLFLCLKCGFEVPVFEWDGVKLSSGTSVFMVDNTLFLAACPACKQVHVYRPATGHRWIPWGRS